MTETKHKKTGFTLLELLIVIAIIAILSVILIIVINPAETLKKSRDVQRMSDLNTLKTALGLYLTSTPSPLLGGANNTTCVGGGGAITAFLSGTGYASGYPTGFTAFGANGGVAAVDGTGWIPVNLSSLSGGSPISNMPLDPINTAGGGGALADASPVYRYACASDLTFELNAALESTAYTVDDNKLTKDGGNSNTLYETGTKLTIMD